MAETVVNPASGAKLIVDGELSLAFLIWVDQVTQAVNNVPPLTGTGTPEAAQVASVGRWYVDTSVGAGSGIYLKETGDGDTGWVARS